VRAFQQTHEQGILPQITDNFDLQNNTAKILFNPRRHYHSAKTPRSTACRGTTKRLKKFSYIRTVQRIKQVDDITNRKDISQLDISQSFKKKCEHPTQVSVAMHVKKYLICTKVYLALKLIEHFIERMPLLSNIR
jgi:hypothetical protein